MISPRAARPVWFVRSINSSFNREVYFSATMASRFEIVNEKYIKELEDKSENENTKRNTGVVKERCATRAISATSENTSDINP